jgi:hypothetical protein
LTSSFCFTQGGLVVDAVVVTTAEPEEGAQVVLWQPLHPDQEPAALPFPACPALDKVVELPPAA